MKTENFRLNIIKRDGGQTVGHIDMNGELAMMEDYVSGVSSMLGKDYIIIVGRCPVYDDIEDKLDQIIQLLKNRSKNE